MNAAETAYLIMKAIPASTRSQLEITTPNTFTVVDAGQPGVLLTNCLIQNRPAIRGSIRITKTGTNEYRVAFADQRGQTVAKYPEVSLSDITDLTGALANEAGPGKIWRFLHQQLITNTYLTNAAFPNPVAQRGETLPEPIVVQDPVGMSKAKDEVEK